ncbi:hypothetical protein D3C86_1816180 [compost metagenome]
MEAIKDKLSVKTEVGGYARYEKDYYFSVVLNDQVPGNPWIISTLWVAEWEIAKAQTLSELAEAYEILHWAYKQTMESGVLPEQLNPLTGDPLSVAPLTWSHSTFVMTVNKYVEKYNELQRIESEAQCLLMS